MKQPSDIAQPGSEPWCYRSVVSRATSLQTGVGIYRQVKRIRDMYRVRQRYGIINIDNSSQLRIMKYRHGQEIIKRDGQQRIKDRDNNDLQTRDCRHKQDIRLQTQRDPYRRRYRIITSIWLIDRDRRYRIIDRYRVLQTGIKDYKL